MNNEEVRAIISKFNSMLKAARLEWVVQEVSTVVERGVEERKEVALESFDVSGLPIKKRGGRKTEVTVTRPFTDFEELRLLLAAIKTAIIDANEIQEKAILGLKSEEVPSPQISFRPDVPEGFKDKGTRSLMKDEENRSIYI
jgi:hypothetical protein